MAWWMVYDTATGAAVSETSVEPVDLPVGLAAAPLGAERPDWSSAAWDPATRAVVALPPPTVRTLTPLQFRQRFTVQERVAITTIARQDAVIETLLDDLRVAEEVDLDDPATLMGAQAMVQALVAAGAVAAEAAEARVAEILA